MPVAEAVFVLVVLLGIAMLGTGEHAMEACQIGSRSGYQGCQACDKVQWFEDDVGSAMPTKSRRFKRSIRYA
jgi:hypothetical protein